MKIKGTMQLILFILIVVMAVSSIPLYFQAKEARNNKIMFEGMVGHALFQIHSHYDSIKISEPATIDELVNVHERLGIIQGYSETVDFAYHTPLLLPISKSLANTTDRIIFNYYKNQSFSEEDLENLSMVIRESKNIIPLIGKTYYVPEQNSESPKVRKKISGFEDLNELHRRAAGTNFK
ncbi:hypothetical protein [Cohnella sp.]|uniref:hypothetical protein n=1 Tax=Cohnella sp. TaxID=1883426 RepID=UPI0037038D82